MTISSANNTPRVIYTATASQTVFTIPFEFFAVTDVKVYVGSTLATYSTNPTTTTQFSIQATTSPSDSAYEYGSGGTLTFGSGQTAGTVITVLRRITIERTVDFPTSSSLDITSLNTEQDQGIAIFGDLNDKISRSITQNDYDESATLTLPAKTDRASKTLAFDSSGNVIAQSAQGVQTVNVATGDAGTSATSTYDATTGVLNLTIPRGSDGTQGPAGSDGSDGIFLSIASQSEAQTGTENTKGMTPLRTKEAINAQVGAISTIASKFFGLKKTVDGTGRSIATQEHTLVGGSENLTISDYDTYFFATGSIFMSIDTSGHLLINMP
ncbi:MAG: hypothetical protein CML86_07425 [Rhodobiaceae bacterium]|nr:hypothetical protein [Rhodobiaceae bacterium]|tara:strand:+ start:19886 stop:20863 length:978 start_codon:yes stop_codon:yes gene_type:complete